MSIIQEISMNADKDQSTEFNIRPIKNNINASKNFNAIDEDKNEGGQTATPARPTVPVVAESQNPQKGEVKEGKEAVWWRSRRFTVMLTIGLILIITGVIWVTVYAVKGPGRTYSARNSFKIPTSGFRSVKIAGESVVMKDQARFGPGKQLSIMVMQTEGEKPSDVIGRTLQETEKPHQAMLTIRDSQTDTLISVTSRELDLKLVVNPTALLQYVLNAQIQQDPDTDNQKPSQFPNLKSNQQPSAQSSQQSQSYLPDQSVKTYNFYQYDSILEQELRNTLKSSNKEIVVSNQATVDLKYDSANQVYRIEDQPPISDEKKNSSASFANPASVPPIKDIINEDEVAQAANVLLANILRSAKEYLRENLDEIQQASGIKLPQTDRSLGATSIYKDQPEDLLKLCQNLDEVTMRCSTAILSSNLLQVSDPEMPVSAKSNIVAFVDQ